ncbi:hypothetical protein [Streptomyces atriruber]|uniref:hypothetical protein n=1 Tax=Streptomyces atriruber TaxID=545121 RepID=UPI0006E3F75A|nr:hypothetical protein [Streptomyces atriruber]
MAVVAVVHGIGKQYLGAHSLHAGVAAALLDGVRLADGPPLTPHDVEVAFYGDCFRPPGARPAKGGDALPGRDRAEPGDVALLLAWWRQAALAEPDRVPPLEVPGTAKAATPLLVQRALRALVRSRFFARAGEPFMIGVLSQVRRYFTETDDGGARARAQEAVAAAVREDTRVLVGHSLGSVIAYEALCAHPEWPVRTLVTIGSPLGVPNFVFDRLSPRPVAGLGRWPGAVDRWTNLCDSRDVVALTKELAPLFPDGGRRVHDVLVHNGWQAHAVERHLTAAETGEAIAAGLRTRENGP